MYSPEIIEESIRAMDTEEIIDRWQRKIFSDESRPIAEAELRRRGIDPEGPMPAPEPSQPQRVSNFSLRDLPLWRQLFSFKGRAPRLKFWLIVPAAWLAFVLLRLLMEVLLERVSYPALLLILIGSLVPIAWVHWATIVQRLHDRNKSGHWAFLLFIPLLGPLWALVELGCLPGTPGPNRFGRK